MQYQTYRSTYVYVPTMVGFVIASFTTATAKIVATGKNFHSSCLPSVLLFKRKQSNRDQVSHSNAFVVEKFNIETSTTYINNTLDFFWVLNVETLTFLIKRQKKKAWGKKKPYSYTKQVLSLILLQSSVHFEKVFKFLQIQCA